MNRRLRNNHVWRLPPLGLAILSCLLSMSLARAHPPIEPLPVPDYSFDLESCTVDGGELDAGDVLGLHQPIPVIALTAAMLGFVDPEDDLNALSGPNVNVTANVSFVLTFSLDRFSLGVAPPDPLFRSLNVPYNAQDQAARGHVPGDQFMSTRLYTRLGYHSGTISNNVLARNNYDEGGTDFAAQPETTAYSRPLDDAIDVVDAMALLPRVDSHIGKTYYSLAAGSPSLNVMPSYGDPSPADIYFSPNPPIYATPLLYAAHDFLFLDVADDIDALIVFDNNADGFYNGTDQVLFSLAPGSPSLITITGASEFGAAADVFSVVPGQEPVLFASAAELGLGAPTDNIDALDFHLSVDPIDCAGRHGIRALLGDLDHDDDVDIEDLATLLCNYGCTAGMDYEEGDLDGDGDIDLADLATLLGVYGDRI